MKLDLTQLITAEKKAETALAARLEAGRAECARRITAVVNATSQINLAAAAAGGLLSAEDAAVYRQGLIWIATMRAAWRPLAEAGRDLSDDKNWPAPSTAIRDLARRF